MTTENRRSPGVHSYDEWSKLDEVIVGRVDGLTHVHLDNSYALMYLTNVDPFLAEQDYFRGADGKPVWQIVEVEQRFVEETVEDLAELTATLEDLGIKVRRPRTATARKEIRTPFWTSVQSPALNIRDQTLILGSTILETAPQIRGRIFENDYLKPLYHEYFESGASWLSMPRPVLAAGALDLDRPGMTETQRLALDDHHVLGELEPRLEMALDGAQCIRIGEDILVNVGNANHELAFQWLRAHFGSEFRFHRLDRLGPDHIDSFLLPLRPGFWLVRNSRVLEYLPEPFRSWDYVTAPEVKEDRFPSYSGTSLPIASRHIDLNVLSVDENTVIVNGLYPELVRLLESRGLVVVPVMLRHRRLIGGGFHCLTLDVRRRGNSVDYR
jgi:glycine amidinotransferase